MSKKNSLEGLVPEVSDTEEEEEEETSSSEEDPDARENYKDEAYWALPENVR